MKAAITASGRTLDANVDPRFGRCAYFLIVETDTMEFEAIENANAALNQGAGIQSAQLAAQKNVRLVLTGHCGPKAHEALAAAGIEMIVGCAGPAREILERLKAGQLSTKGGPDGVDHAGMAPSPSSSPAAPSSQPLAPGSGMGRGPCGGGRGKGRGGRRGGSTGGGGGSWPGRSADGTEQPNRTGGMRKRNRGQ